MPAFDVFANKTPKSCGCTGDQDQFSWQKLTIEPFSNEAANYDAKHEKTIAEIGRRLEARRGLIGVEWVEDDDGSDEKGRAVRVLDYACGTGSMSRVSTGPSFAATVQAWITIKTFQVAAWSFSLFSPFAQNVN